MPDHTDLAYALGGAGKRRSRFDDRRKYALQQLQQGSDMSPVQSPWQGVGRLAQALAGGVDMYMTDREEKAVDKKRSDALAQAMAEPDPQKRIGLIAAYDPDTGARAAGQLAIEQAKQQQQQAMLKSGADSFGGAYGIAPAGGNAGAIAGIESGGRYDAVGPVANAQGQRAYGKFQVLEPNIGPWTQEVLGRPMTPQEFLANPEAQNKVFEAKFGQYVTKYGSPLAASRAWFAGEGGMNNPNAKDVNGVSVAQYEQKFNNGLGGQQQAAPGAVPLGTIAQAPLAPPQGQAPMPAGQPPQIAQGDGTPPQPSAQGIAGPAVVAPPGVPDVPRPQPSQQQLQQYQQRIRAGEFGMGPDAVSKARSALDADLDRQWQVDRERRFKEFDQQTGDYRAQRDQQMKQPQESVQTETKIREQFDQLQSVKDYRKAATVFRSAVDAAKTDTAAADLNLVYAFATLMDPGSVVRDAETGMVIATQSAGDRIKGMVAMVTGGSRLDPAAKKALINEMGSRYESYKVAHDDLANTFKGIATRSRANPDNVVVPYPAVEWKKPKDGAGAPGVPPPPGFRPLQ